MAPLAGETRWTIAGEVGDQIGTVSTEQAGSFGAIIGINLAALAFPSWQAVAFVATLLKRHASRTIIAGIPTRRARIYSNIAIDSGISRSAETGVIVKSRLVLAHSSFRARIVRAVGLLLLAIDARITIGTLAPVSLR